MKLSIIIPIYNESRWLPIFWERLRTAPIDRCTGVESVEIVVVDDGSTDGTADAVAKLEGSAFRFECGMPAEVRVKTEKINRGKGYALRQAIKLSTGDIVLTQDADMEYSPLDYPELITPFTEQKADAVIGSRFVGHPRRVLYFWHSVMNWLLTLMSNMLNDLNVTDMETGYKVVRGDLIRNLRLTSMRFGIEPELISRLAQARCRIFEVPIRYEGRTYREGKKITAKDGIAAIFHILRFGLWDKVPFEPGLMQTLTALDNVGDNIYLPLVRRAMGAIPKAQPEPRILELGAGIGTLTEELANYGHVVATDLSPGFVEKMRQRFSNNSRVEVKVLDATDSPREDSGKYHVVVASNVLEHLENDVGALKNWRAMLGPRGIRRHHRPTVPGPIFRRGQSGRSLPPL